MGPRGGIGVVSHKTDEGMIEREPRLIVKWCKVAPPEESSDSSLSHGLKLAPTAGTPTMPLPVMASHDSDGSPIVDVK